MTVFSEVWLAMLFEANNRNVFRSGSERTLQVQCNGQQRPQKVKPVQQDHSLCRLHCYVTLIGEYVYTNVQSNLAKGSIAVLSSSAACAGQAHSPATAGGEQCTNALKRRYVKVDCHMSASKVKSAPSRRGSGPSFNTWFLGPT